MNFKSIAKAYCLDACINGQFIFDTVYNILIQSVKSDTKIEKEFLESDNYTKRVIDLITYVIENKKDAITNMKSLSDTRDVLIQMCSYKPSEEQRTEVFRNKQIFKLWAECVVYFDVILKMSNDIEVYDNAHKLFINTVNFAVANDYIRYNYDSIRRSIPCNQNLRKELGHKVEQISKLSSIKNVKDVFSKLGDFLGKLSDISLETLSKTRYTLPLMRESGLLRYDNLYRRNCCEICGKEDEIFLVKTAIKGYSNFNALVCKDCFKEHSMKSSIKKGEGFIVQFYPLTEKDVKSIETITNSIIILPEEKYPRLSELGAIQTREDLHNSCDLCSKDNLQIAIQARVKCEDNHERTICKQCYDTHDTDKLTPNGRAYGVTFSSDLSEENKKKIVAWFTNDRKNVSTIKAF